MEKKAPAGFVFSEYKDDPKTLYVDKEFLRSKKANGFTWGYSEDGAHFFQKCLDPRWRNRFALMRCLPEDLENGNFEFFAKHGLTNNNPA